MIYDDDGEPLHSLTTILAEGVLMDATGREVGAVQHAAVESVPGGSFRVQLELDVRLAPAAAERMLKYIAGVAPVRQSTPPPYLGFVPQTNPFPRVASTNFKP